MSSQLSEKTTLLSVAIGFGSLYKASVCLYKDWVCHAKHQGAGQRHVGLIIIAKLFNEGLHTYKNPNVLDV